MTPQEFKDILNEDGDVESTISVIDYKNRAHGHIVVIRKTDNTFWRARWMKHGDWHSLDFEEDNLPARDIEQVYPISKTTITYQPMPIEEEPEDVKP